MINAFIESGSNVALMESFLKKPTCHIFSHLGQKELEKALEIKEKSDDSVIFCNTKIADEKLVIKAFESGCELFSKKVKKIRLDHKYFKQNKLNIQLNNGYTV